MGALNLSSMQSCSGLVTTSSFRENIRGTVFNDFASVHLGEENEHEIVKRRLHKSKFRLI